MKAYSRISFLLSIFSFFFSCRTTPENKKFENESISSGKPVSVKINFLGVDQENNIPENNLISENNSRGGG